MQKSFTTLLSLLILGLSSPLLAQPAILLVDDTDDGFGHVTDLQEAIDSAGYTYTVFNAVDSSRSPSDLEIGGLRPRDLADIHNKKKERGNAPSRWRPTTS
ncbi:MAG: hypothetical protein D6722_05135 [Bacteroidetes bacterium]|nr:MAG: hypothetical protein D6722_05135 [Bacteroidota bacterium]